MSTYRWWTRGQAKGEIASKGGDQVLIDLGETDHGELARLETS